MLEIENISKTYSKSSKKAISDINLTIDDGDIYGFIGPNGSGKSTTIKCIVGIHDFEGDILLNGISIKSNPIEFKKITSYVPDNPDLYEHLTGIGYIDFVANIYNVGSNKKELIHKYAKMFDIESNLGNAIKTYSHGMKQKIALIAALIHNPKLLVLDEPFVGLDPMATHNLKEVMKELCNNGTIIFFSSHVLEVVEKLCNKIAIIKNGKIIISGPTDEVKGNLSLEDAFLDLYENKEELL